MDLEDYRKAKKLLEEAGEIMIRGGISEIHLDGFKMVKNVPILHPVFEVPIDREWDPAKKQLKGAWNPAEDE